MKCRPLFCLLATLICALTLSLQAQTSNGSLKVTSFPSGANVSIDGVDTGKVTPMSTSVSVGDHTVVVAIPNSGWNPDTRPVTIVSGNNDLSVTLLPTLTAGPPGPQGIPGTNGTNGINGISVTTVALPIGNANCPTGGSAFTSATGTIYACNGSVPELERWNLVGTTGEPAFGGRARIQTQAERLTATQRFGRPIGRLLFIKIPSVLSISAGWPLLME